MNEDEKFDKFIQGLKREVKLEVLKSTAANFEEAAGISFRVGNVLWNSKSQYKFSIANCASFPTPMEIGNFEQSRKKKFSSIKNQRRKDIENNACFTCHIPGCRPWRHR